MRTHAGNPCQARDIFAAAGRNDAVLLRVISGSRFGIAENQRRGCRDAPGWRITSTVGANLDHSGPGTFHRDTPFPREYFASARSCVMNTTAIRTRHAGDATSFSRLTRMLTSPCSRLRPQRSGAGLTVSGRRCSQKLALARRSTDADTCVDDVAGRASGRPAMSSSQSRRRNPPAPRPSYGAFSG